eukprot:g17063.t1
MSDEEDIILSDLNDDELVDQMFDDLYDGLKEEIEEGVRILLDRGWTPYDILTKALVGGMTIVGHDFRDGILFVPEVLLAANAMKGGMAILKPLLAETGAPRMGKMVIGTVKGDIHDIGKNLVAMMMEGAGFEVVDLGINNAVEAYIEAAAAEQADIVGMSALLTTTMPYMKVVIDTMKEQGVRDDYIVLVGGAPLNEEFGRAIGADAYCRDAAVAVETAKQMIARKHNQGIADAVRKAVEDRRGDYDQVFVAYADCGTGGDLARVCDDLGVQMIRGPHCYAFFEGVDAFVARDEIFAFYLTDFLTRQFDTFVWKGLKIDKHPQLRDMYFGHYQKLIYLAQTDDPGLTARAQEAADRLGLAFERRYTGEHFAIDKPAGVPCPNLDGHHCKIHRWLRVEGFSGCTVYSCGGAGQRVTQELFAGQSWRDDPALTVPMMEAFRGMRAIQDRLAILMAAQQNLPLDAQDQATVSEMIGWLLPDAVDFDVVRFFPGSVILKPKARQLGLGIDAADLRDGQIVVQRTQHGDQPPHDHRIAFAVEPEGAAVDLREQPDLAGAAVDLVGGHFQRQVQRVHRLAQFDHVAIAVFPVLEELEIFDNLFECGLGHGLSYVLGQSCGRIRDSRINPFNWFGRAEARQLDGSESNPLIPRRSALAARELPDTRTRGAYEVALRPVESDETPEGLVQYEFVAYQPMAPQGTEASRSLTAAARLTDQELAKISRIEVLGARNALSTRR